MLTHPRLLFTALALIVTVHAGARVASAPRPFVGLTLGTVRGLTVDKQDNLYIPDPKTAILYKIAPDGTTTSTQFKPLRDLFSVAIAPDGTTYAIESICANAYRLTASGPVSLIPEGAKDLFLGPTALACDAAGNLFVAENDCNLVRKVTPSGEISIYAGAFKQGGTVDGDRATARFTTPRSLALDPAGNIYIGDEKDFVIRRIAPGGYVTTLAGKPGEKGFVDGSVADARFNNPRALVFDSLGNLYVADSDNHAVRMISPEGIVTTIAGVRPPPPAAAVQQTAPAASK